MKKTILIILSMMFPLVINAQVAINPAENEEDFPQNFFTDSEISEESIEGYLQQDDSTIILERSDFPQTYWDECNENVSGNYLTYGCTRRRLMASIFKTKLNQAIFSCVDKALAAQGYGKARGIHIQHAGIACDNNHNRRSLHCQNRAIDVKAFQLRLNDGRSLQFTYSKLGNRPFYTALRDCWGRAVVNLNACPVRGSYSTTASIGWEDSGHGRHMHLSLPVCSRGSHVGNYFVK